MVRSPSPEVVESAYLFDFLVEGNRGVHRLEAYRVYLNLEFDTFGVTPNSRLEVYATVRLLRSLLTPDCFSTCEAEYFRIRRVRGADLSNDYYVVDRDDVVLKFSRAPYPLPVVKYLTIDL